MTGRCAGEKACRLPVHACVVPTRQAVVMVHVVVGARSDHGMETYSVTPRPVNRAARGMQQGCVWQNSPVLAS